MEEKKKAPTVVEALTKSKGNDIQPNTQANSTKEPQHISEVMQEAANLEKCSRSGEVSLMAIIAKRMKGGKK